MPTGRVASGKFNLPITFHLKVIRVFLDVAAPAQPATITPSNSTIATLIQKHLPGQIPALPLTGQATQAAYQAAHQYIDELRANPRSHTGSIPVRRRLPKLMPQHLPSKQQVGGLSPSWQTYSNI